jgi:hypothetical protein
LRRLIFRGTISLRLNAFSDIILFDSHARGQSHKDSDCEQKLEIKHLYQNIKKKGDIFIMAGTKQDYIVYRVLKSNEVFEVGKLLANNHRWNSCVNSLYYSIFD